MTAFKSIVANRILEAIQKETGKMINA